VILTLSSEKKLEKA